MNSGTAVKSYLIGLLLGRGHILADDKRIIIEFAHKNKTVEGITSCLKCGGLVTKSKSQPGKLVCKDCGTIAESNNAILYEQVESTKTALNDTIIPYLKAGIKGKYSVLGNNTITILTIDVEDNSLLDYLASLFPNTRNYYEFHLPKQAYDFDSENKTELINGLLDTAGFPSTGGWLNRDGRNGHGRMRAYFQIVRNWNLVVELDNFLRSEFELPIHTIDWGHPNIRDGNLKDYFETNPTSWSREHQLKFFPEYYQGFRFRLSHKQKLFEELIAHNERAGFDEKWDWTPGKILEAKLKAYHPGEADPRLPEAVRRHFDAFWQVNLALGCKYLSKIVADTANPECFVINGIDEPCDKTQLEARYDEVRKAKTDAIFRKHANTTRRVSPTSRGTGMAEIDMYEPLVGWLQNYLVDKYDEPTEVIDVSATNLNNIVKRSSASLSAFDFCYRFHISPDVVGFMGTSNSLAFIEAKITALNLGNVGQLLGYCLVAQPKEAILVSTLQPSISLIRSIQAKPEILDYGNGRIQIATMQNNELTFMDI